ncbi:hypothetical protein [Xanthocytophaga flava]|uniref:hypothetical protein n=1 Tax=Xanthocytophaga flava TaxID=3048013 RepID=UPI0028D24B0E|nr:hypothetical protein [Xanthocytophaga flavus]MDJ1473223.1 hypothetical protein [Xanthocytophaga flavus]
MLQYTRLGFPHIPASCPSISADRMSLCDIRNYLKDLIPESTIQTAILSIRERWLNNPHKVEPLTEIRKILDSIRSIPRSEWRLICMNTFVQVLGQPEIFATFLDMIRDSSQRQGTQEQALSEASRKSSKHAVYGWCGQTRLILSSTEHNSSVVTAEHGVQELLGKTPVSAWSLSMHIWQPNPNAKGFLCGHRTLQNIITEPPHSHPFDFASVVVIGKIHQSIYTQHRSELLVDKKKIEFQKGRYDGIILEHVHGVWPPHAYSEKSSVSTLEDRVELNAGDSYFMSCNTIHDVQIDASVAQLQPAITLFLRSESFVKPHVYMSSSMADFHISHPNLKNQGYPLLESDWNQKLELVANYIRGKTTALNLSNIVKYDNEYAFFHI